MDKSNLITHIIRLKETLDQLSSETANGFINRGNPGKSQSSRLKRNNLISRVKHLTESIRNTLTSGHILDITYLQINPNGETRKYHAVLTDISRPDFEYFIRQMNNSRDGIKIKILEIREIPTFIKEVPL